MSARSRPGSARVRSLELLILNLLAVACALWFVTLARTSLTDVPADGFTLVSRLPVTFWAGFGCAIVAFLIGLAKPQGRHQYVEVLIGVALVLFVFGTPQFVYENVRIRDVYGVIRDTERAVVDGHVSIGVGAGGMSTYPLSTFAIAIVTEVLGISLEALARWFPIYFMLVLVVMAGCMAQQTSAKAVVAVLLPIAFAWTPEYNLSPQAYALMLYAALWVLFLKTYGSAEPRRDAGVQMLVMVLVGTIVATHIGTPVFLLANFVAVGGFFVASRFVPRLRSQSAAGLQMLTITLLTMVIWFTWLMYVSVPTFRAAVRLVGEAVQEAVRGNLTAIPDFSGASDPEPHFALANRIRIAMTVCQVGLGLACIAVLWSQGRRWLAGLLGAWFVGCFLTVPISMASYAQMYVSRPLLFSSIALAPLVGASFARGRAALAAAPRRPGVGGVIWEVGVVALLVACVALLPLTRTCGDGAEYFSSSTLAAIRFASELGIAANPARPPHVPRAEALRLDSNDHDYLRLWGRGDEYVEWARQDVSPEYYVIYDSGESQIGVRPR